MAGSTTGLNVFANLPPRVSAFYEKVSLIRRKNTLLAYELCQKKSLPENEGSTVRFWRYAPQSLTTSALTESLDGNFTPADADKLVEEEVLCTPAMWGKWWPFGKLAGLTSIDKGTANKVDVISQQAFESIDYYVQKKMAQSLLRRRADGDNTYQAEGTLTTGSLTVPADTARAEADNYWNGGFITIIDGPGYGQTRQITSFANSGGVFTLASSFDTVKPTPTTASRYRVVVGTGINAAAKITTEIARQIILDLKVNKAIKYENGFYVGILDPFTEYDFLADPLFQKVTAYQDKEMAITNEIGKWAGIRWAYSTRIYRETVAGVEGFDTGAVHVVSVLGKEAFGVVNIGGSKGKRNFDIKIKSPDQLGQPLDHYSTIGWQAFFETTELNPCFGVNVLCGASAQL